VSMKVSLWDVDADVQLSEEFTYTVETEYSLADTIIHFTNSDGGLDTLRCKGEAEEYQNYNNEEAQRTLTTDDTMFDGDERLVYSEQNNSYIFYSGYKNATDLRYIQELIMSEKIFLYKQFIEDETYVVIPVFSKVKQILLHQTKKNLKEYVLEFRESITSRVSSARHYPIF
jgi:hypothetical protein